VFLAIWVSNTKTQNTRIARSLTKFKGPTSLLLLGNSIYGVAILQSRWDEENWMQMPADA
jgi:hypothetical protein